MFGLDQPTHILIILIVLVLLFGSAKLPKAAKSLGESMRIFKQEAKKLHNDDGPGNAPVQSVTQQELPAPVVGQQPSAQELAAQAQQMALQAQQFAAQSQQASAHAASGATPTQPSDQKS